MYCSKKIINYALILLMLSGIQLAHAYRNLDSAVAIVEDNVILESELQQRLTHLNQKQPSVVVNDAIRRQVLNQLILEKLQLRIANRIKLDAPQAQVEEMVTQFKRGLNAEGKNFADYLAIQGISEEQFRKAIKEDIRLQKVQEGNINRRIRVTEREIDDFLASKAGQDWLETRFRLAHILLPVAGDNEAEVLNQAQTIFNTLQQPQSKFSELAATHSKGPNANKGGDLGWRKKDELPSAFLEQVASLKAGQVTRPFRSNAGVHILKVVERSGSEPFMVERFKVRHLLITPSILFTDKEAKAKIDNLYQQVMNGENFDETAKKYTEDVSTKAKGGDLGWSTPGQFVPEFEKTMKATPIGAVSKPFRSQFGWHILKVEDHRIEDMFETVKRNQVVNILRQRRFQDELQLWLQELREDAYVKVLI